MDHPSTALFSHRHLVGEGGGYHGNVAVLLQCHCQLYKNIIRYLDVLKMRWSDTRRSARCRSKCTQHWSRPMYQRSANCGDILSSRVLTPLTLLTRDNNINNHYCLLSRLIVKILLFLFKHWLWWIQRYEYIGDAFFHHNPGLHIQGVPKKRVILVQMAMKPLKSIRN